MGLPHPRVIESDININKIKIHEATSSLPRTVDDAYERILSKSKNAGEAKELLYIIVAAVRPLTVAEMGLALALQNNRYSYQDLEVMPEARFRKYVTDLCGLFVTVKDSKIYLLHQTAKEFLVPKDDPGLRGDHDNRLMWKSSLRPPESHRILYKICIYHLSFSEFEFHPLHRSPGAGPNWEISRYLRDYIFLDYSATNRAAHFRASHLEDNEVINEILLRICSPSSRFQTWFRIYCASIQMDLPLGFTSLMIASYFGIERIVDSVEKIRQELLLSAAEKGHKPTIKRLLENGAAIEGVDSTGRTPLSGVIIEAMDSTGRTPLSYAAVNGHDAIVQLLVATSQVNVRRATIHEGELDFRENVIEPQSVGKLDTIDPHLVELDHHVQGSPLVPAGSDAGDATEMISEPVDAVIRPGLQDTYVDEFSQQLSDELQKLLMIEELPEGFYGFLLPESLRSFSRRLHGESTNRAQQEASAFVYRHTREIVKSVALTFPGKPHSQSSDNDILEKETGTSGPRATEIEGSPADAEYKKTLPPREPFNKDPIEVTQCVTSLDSRISSEPSSAVGDVESQNQSRDSPLPQIEDYRSFIETSHAYQRLLSSLKKHLQLDMPNPNLMHEIGASIRRKLLEDETMRKSSRIHAQSSVQMTFTAMGP
uniref:GPI inositol-deacylase winged helix domain-containing protein n=1 Tax=Bionectria ochroleuca TaxID=29856 RepID=A0A8H7N0C3_BIOOC